MESQRGLADNESVRWTIGFLVAAGVVWAVSSGMLTDRIADAGADAVYTRAAWTGVDPYLPYPELADRLNLDFPDYGTASKTPAMAVLGSLWLPVPIPAVDVVVFVVDVAALFFIVRFAADIVGRNPEWWWWLILAVAVPVRLSLWWGNPIFVLVALVLWTWKLVQRGDGWWVGVPLGLAASVRLWPLLLFFPLWCGGRRKAAVMAAGLTVGLNLAGLAFPSITMTSAVDGLIHAGEVWVGWGNNASLARLFGGSPTAGIVIVAAAVVAAWLLARRYRLDATGAVAILAVAASPLAWMSYYLITLPVVIRRWPVTVLPALLIGFSGYWGLVLAGGVGLLAVEVRRLSRQDRTSPAGYYPSTRHSTPTSPPQHESA